MAISTVAPANSDRQAENVINPISLKPPYDFWHKWDAAIETVIKNDPLRNPVRATIVDMEMARLPSCIVENFLFKEVGHIAAPGGVGKTTVMLYICIKIVLGDDVFGREVREPGPVVYLSGEDNAETLRYCLWQMCTALELCQDDLELIERDLHIIDASGHSVKLTQVEKGGAVVPSNRVNTLITTLQAIDPVLLIIDPAISFGVGESRVNNAEQALVEVGRKILRHVKCAVIYVHHTGKAGVRDGESKQYSGRGGSAFSDGGRMTFTLEHVTPDKWTEATGNVLDEETEEALLFSLPKLKFTRRQSAIYIKRTGWEFTAVEPIENSEGAETAIENDALKIETFLREKLAMAETFSQNDLFYRKLLPQHRIRAAVSYLKQHNRVTEEKKPGIGRGGAHKYLRPVDITTASTG